MTGNERGQILCECFMLRFILDALPDSLPHLREMKIQNKKLLRMFDKTNPNAFAVGAFILGGGSLKKFNKEQGKKDRAIGEQRRKVRQLSDLFFKEMLRQNLEANHQQRIPRLAAEV